MFLPACLLTSRDLGVSEITLYNEADQITQLKNVNHMFNVTWTCPYSLVVFISGAPPRTVNSQGASLSWSVTFAQTSRRNLTGTLQYNIPRTALCGEQKAILRFLDFVRSDDFDILWRKVIIVVSNDTNMSRMVCFLENDAFNNGPGHKPSRFSDRGRRQLISQSLKQIRMAKDFDVEFWRVPKDQMVQPLPAASNELNSSGSSGQSQ
ncbi:hypothetical protein NW767_013541 [Fusarium falciforme]|nr:hypothetical protein NW767_013541 [Fusarium falciforme]